MKKRPEGKSVFAGLVAGCFLLLLPGLSFGFGGGPWQERQEMREKIQSACGESLEALCGEARGPGTVRCLLDHYDETSAECQALLDELETRREEERERRRARVTEACGESLKTLCAGDDGPGCVRCLMEHYEETSSECKALLDEIRAKPRPGRGPMPF